MSGMPRPLTALLLCALAALTGGCDQLGIESASAVAARRDADGKAVGGACRHAGRAIEDCYTLNRRADKAAIYAGWREMDDYMRENKLTGVAPVLAAQDGKARTAADDGSTGDEPAAAASAGKADKGEKPAKADRPAKAAHAEKLAKADNKPADAATAAEKPAAR